MEKVKENQNGMQLQATNNVKRKNNGWKKLLVGLLLIIPILVSLKSWDPIEGIFIGKDFVTATVEHIDGLKLLSKELPVLAEKAKNDEKTLVELEEKLIVLKADIIEFNDQTKPSLLGDLPDEIIRRNSMIEEELDKYLVQVQNNNPGTLSETQLVQNIGYLTNMLDENNDIKEGWREESQ